MEKVKATNTSILKKIVQSQGLEYEKEFLRKLSPKGIALYNCAMASAWITIAEEKEIMEAAARLFFPDQPTAMRNLGYLLAQHTFTGLYKIFLRIPTTSFLISHLGTVWGRFNNYGKASIENLTKTSGTVVVREAPAHQSFQREIVAGYFVACLELAGAKHVVVRIDDSDATAWKWHVTWE